MILFLSHIPSNKAGSFIMPTPHLLCLVMVFFHRMIHKNVCMCQDDDDAHMRTFLQPLCYDVHDEQ